MSFDFQVARPGQGQATEWFFIHGGDTAGGAAESGMALSCCRPRGTGIKKMRRRQFGNK
jgi:hypothetical protein